MSWKLTHSASGFTLIELSIVMLIISIVLGMTLSFGALHMERSQKENTQEQLIEITKAIALFVEQNQRLPCPALANLAMNNANFGRESTTCANTTGVQGPAGSPMRIGMVPVRTLGLPDDYALDGWERRITYIIDQRFANHGGGNFRTNRQGIFAIGSTAGSSDIATAMVNDDSPILILISHGYNGFGAWTRQGNTRLNSLTPFPDEQANAHTDTGIFTESFVQRSEADNFDDIVLFQTKNQVKKTIANIPTNVCNIAAEVRTTTPNVICRNTTYTNNNIRCNDHFAVLEAIITRLCAQ